MAGRVHAESNMQPLVLYSANTVGPNPLKVMLVLELLNLDYTDQIVHLADVKGPKYTAINPNGRLPALVDPNANDLTLWESGAIIEYLVDQYDTDHTLGFPLHSEEYYHAKQWMAFQISGQGPYYGQASWFKRLHHELLPSAVQRYVDEAKRIMGVLDHWLAERKWLVGDRMSYADVAFIPWQRVMSQNFEAEGLGDDGKGDFVNYWRWMNAMLSVPAIEETLTTTEKRAAIEWSKMQAFFDAKKQEARIASQSSF